jgi:uncharacterized membrane protein
MRIMTKDPEKRASGLFAIVLILFFSSFFMPFVMIFLLQDFLYHSSSHWLFIAPGSAFLTFFIAMITIPIILAIYLHAKTKSDEKWIRWVTCLIILSTIPFFLLSISNYYYFDDKGIHYNYLMSLGETDYQWENMMELKEIWVLENGVSRLDDYLLVLEDHTELRLSAAFNKDFNLKNKVYHILENNGIKLSSNREQLYEE